MSCSCCSAVFSAATSPVAACAFGANEMPEVLQQYLVYTTVARTLERWQEGDADGDALLLRDVGAACRDAAPTS